MKIETQKSYGNVHVTLTGHPETDRVELQLFVGKYFREYPFNPFETKLTVRSNTPEQFIIYIDRFTTEGT